MLPLLLLACLLAGSLSAKQEFKNAPPAGEPGVRSAGPVDSPQEAEQVQMLVEERLFAHNHNKVIHVPIALGMVAALFMALVFFWPEYWDSTRLLLLFAGLSSCAAVVSGLHQSGNFLDGPYRHVLKVHMILGYLVSALCFAGFGLTFITQSRRWLWLLGGVLAVLIFMTGLYGGILAHG
jgi:hypothetical protein